MLAIQVAINLANAGPRAARARDRDQRRSARGGPGVRRGAPAAGCISGRPASRAWRFARPERAVLLLGPPRSGKTSGGDHPGGDRAHRPGGRAPRRSPTSLARPGGRAGGRAGCGCSTRPAALARDGAWGAAVVADAAARSTWDGALLIARAMTAGATSAPARRTVRIGPSAPRRCWRRCCTRPPWTAGRWRRSSIG